MIHALKTWPEYFKDVESGRKPFEYRKDDRGGFKAGDILILQEYDPEKKEYLEGVALRRVTLVIKDAPGLPKGYCIMGIREFSTAHVDQRMSDHNL